jgi:hypothetical protein
MPPRPKKKKDRQTLIQRKIQKIEAEMVDMDAYRWRVKLESMKWRSLQTYKDVVDLLELQVNKLQVVEPEARHDMIKEVSAMAYISAVQLQAIKAAKAEKAPQEMLSHKLQQDHLSLNMTQEEVRELSRATNISVQINVLNKVAERPEMAAIEAEVISQDLLGQTKEQRKELPGMLTTAIREATYLAREKQEEILDFAPPEPMKQPEEDDE